MPASRKEPGRGMVQAVGQGDQYAVHVVQNCQVVGGRAAAGELVRHGLSALRFDVHGDRDTYTILELIDALGVSRTHAAAADESQAEPGHRGTSRCGWSRAIERGALRWGGRVRGRGRLGREMWRVRAHKSFFQKTLEVRRGGFWLIRGCARPRRATGGAGCDVGGGGFAGAVWRGLDGRFGGVARCGEGWLGGLDGVAGGWRAAGVGWG